MKHCWGDMCDDEESVQSNELHVLDTSTLDSRLDDSLNSLKSKFTPSSHKTTSVKDLKMNLKEVIRDRDIVCKELKEKRENFEKEMREMKNELERCSRERDALNEKVVDLTNDSNVHILKEKNTLKFVQHKFNALNVDLEVVNKSKEELCEQLEIA